jgi:acetyl-CoA C-acetyltransferase
VSSLDLLMDAIRNALDDAGLKASDIDGVLCRGPDESYSHHQLLAERLGINARFSTTLTNGGASQIMSVALAVMAIRFGLANTIVCGFGRDTWSRTHASEEARVRNETRPESMLAREFGPEYGYFGATAAHAFGATRHMHLYGTTRDDFGEIAVAFREHALRNPDASMKKPLSIEDYHAGRLIVAPFGIYDCSLRSDAAGAVIVTSAARAKDLKKPPVLIKGFGFHNNTRGWFADDNMVVTAAKQAGEAAYAMAGLGPKDVDTAQIYDCFTYMVLTQLEDYGFCKKGEGGRFVMDGNLISGVGKLPFNTDGGGLCNNHPANRGGVTKVIEAVRQLRGEAHPAVQVPNCTWALANGIGGALASRHTSGTLILERV